MKYSILFLILVLLQQLPAQNLNLNLSGMNYGIRVGPVTASSLGLGGATVTGDDPLFSVISNPALAANNSGLIKVNVGAAYHKLEEDRSYPYYDNFGGFVDYGSYYFNKNWYGSYYGLVAVKLPFKQLMDLSFATGVMPYLEFNYNYKEEVRSANYGDALLAYNVIRSDGNIYALPFSVAFSPVKEAGFLDKLSAGIAVKRLTGRIEQRWLIEARDPSLEPLAYQYDIERTLDNNPFIPSAGFQVEMFKRLRLAAVYRHNYKLTFKHDTLKVDEQQLKIQKIIYPSQLEFGLGYRFQNLLEARIYAAFEYTFWSQFEDNQNEGPEFDDAYALKAGVEHIFLNKVPFRVGINYRTLREDKKAAATLITFGIGYQVAGVRLDFAAGISSLQFFQSDPFVDENYGVDLRSRIKNHIGNDIYSNKDRVKWHESFIRFDLSYTLDWH